MTRKDRKIKTNSTSGLNNINDIYEEYHDELKGYIKKRVPLKDDVEDILQNVFYNLAKIDLAENPIEQISSWLYSVTKNQIIDKTRKKKEERLPSLKNDFISDDDYDKDISEILSDPADNPEIEYIQSLMWGELEIALNELPYEQRNIFELTELQGFSFKEISETVNIPINTLISRKRYAVLYLREKLRDLYDDIIKN